MGLGAFLKGAVKGVKGAVKKILPKKDSNSEGGSPAPSPSAPLMNSAFVFIKPHAVNDKVSFQAPVCGLARRAVLLAGQHQCSHAAAPSLRRSSAWPNIISLQRVARSSAKVP